MLGHQGIDGNEEVHDVARKITQNIQVGPTCALTYEAVKTIRKQRSVERQIEYWWDVLEPDMSKFTMGRTSWTRRSELIKLSKKQTRLAVVLL